MFKLPMGNFFEINIKVVLVPLKIHRILSMVSSTWGNFLLITYDVQLNGTSQSEIGMETAIENGWKVNGTQQRPTEQRDDKKKKL